MRKLKVGVVGCGQIAQIMHLPYLAELPQFEIAAVCDISPKVVNAVGEQYRVQHRYTDYRDMIAKDEIDAIAVLTVEHTEIAEAAAYAGKHLFIEKPLCFDPEEGDRILDAAQRNGVKLMVAYMKRYDPGYEYGAAYMQAMADVRLIRIHDIGGDNGVHMPLYTLVNSDDIPEETLTGGQAKIKASIKAALGSDLEHLGDLYFKLLMLSSHDMTILRGAFGPPKGVLYSDTYSESEIISVLDYGNQRRCIYEIGLWPEYRWFNEQMTAYGKDEIVTIAFPNPYVKYAPTLVTIQGNENGLPVRKEIPVSHQEAFRLEWLHFYDCITEDHEPRTTGVDAKADVELAREMIRALRAS